MIATTIFYFMCCFVLYTIVVSTPVNECSQGGLVPEEVTVDGCETSQVCKVQFNGMFNMTMKFKAPHYLETMKPNLIGKTALGNIKLVGESSNDDVCQGILNTFCPLVEKELIEYKYSVKLTVLPLLPITMEFSILDMELNETTVCFDLDVTPVL